MRSRPVGLTTALIGSRGDRARDTRTYDQALATLMVAYGRQMALYQACYPDIAETTALELALADTMWRGFYETFSRLADEYDVYLTAATLAPVIQVSTSEGLIAWLGDPDLEAQSQVYLPVGSEVYNTAYLFDPDGQIVGLTRKVHLPPDEGEGEVTLNLARGSLEQVRVYQTPMWRVGLAICLDAFQDSYLEQLEVQGASIVVQPSWNNGMWANEGELWQPEDWLGLTLGSIRGDYPSLQYNINTMITGNLFDMVVDGQSAITRKATEAPVERYVGLDAISDWRGSFEALAPWTMEDPGLIDPTLSLDDRRALLHERALELQPGSGSPVENGYVEQVIAADLPIIP